jgi:hypothetical protein
MAAKANFLLAAMLSAVGPLASDAGPTATMTAQIVPASGPTLSLTVMPSMALTIPSTAPLGTAVWTLQGVWSDGSPFTGSYTFVSTHYDADTYTISGSNVIIATNGPGVGSDGGMVDQVTIEAIQIALTADGITSPAPNGGPLATSAGLWSWGPVQAGRQLGGGGFQGDNVTYLSGKQVGSGFLMKVAHGGQFYLNNSLFGWFLWTGTQFVPSSPP